MAIELLETNAEGLIRRHESSVVEYKANFNFGSLGKYAKTMAAFANNRGGTIVFGISNRPRRPIGMTNDQFSKLDPEKLAGEVNRLFSPEIRWSLSDHLDKDSHRFGFLVVEESNFKPVIALTNAGNYISEGMIYYRYNGRNGNIKPAELMGIIEGIRKSEQNLWMDHIRRIAKIGPSKAAVFNPADGLVEGARGSFLIDKSLLSGLSFIREGDLKPSGGAPVYTLQGRAEIVSGDTDEGLIGIAERAISENDIIVNFLNRVEVHSPVEYLKAIVSSNSKYLPLYYYAAIAGLGRSAIDDFITSVHGYQRYHDRLRDDKTRLPVKLRSTGSRAAIQKKKIHEDLLSYRLEIVNDQHWLKYFFEVLRSIDAIDIISYWLKETYKLPLRRLEAISEFRYAACYLDWLLNGRS